MTQPKALWDGFSYKAHQTTGIEWMMAREKNTPSGGIVCDEMGLGKTIQLLGLIKSAAAPRSETLLIAPVAVLSQWEETARKSGITVYLTKKGTSHLGWSIQGTFRPAAPRIYIIGYEAARSKSQFTTMRAWDRVICDEAHRAASAKGFFTMIQHIVAKNRWFLTATPIVNSISDLTHLYELLGLEDASVRTGSPDALKASSNELILARTMKQLRNSIPDAPPEPISKTISLSFLTEDEAEFYRGMAGGIVKRWKALESDGGAGIGLLKLKLFMRLRQLSLHPQVYIESRRKALGTVRYEREDWAGSSTKFEEIKRLIQVANGQETPRKWLIFCHFHPEMTLLKDALSAEPYIRDVGIYNGSLSHGERKKLLESTKKPLPDTSQADVLLVQLQSGGVGLNLQHFNRIIFSGPWWTSALMEQAIGRAVRIGQSEVVHVYHLKLKEEEAINIDRVMMEKAAEKGELCKKVLADACSAI